MTYREPLSPDLAQSMLGEDYDKSKSYTLIFDIDKTILLTSDSSGTVVGETVLEQNYEKLPDDWVDEDDIFFNPPSDTAKKFHVSVGLVITMVLTILMFAGLCLTGFILWKGGVL